MKALIFNSGIGKRMGELTAHAPKSMVPLYNGETIFERQIRLLQEAGIRDVVITTGPYPEMLKAICSKPCFSNMSFSFAHNEIFDSSNYIFSMFRAQPFIRDSDILMMHGDLVFDRDMLPSLLKDPRKDVCLIDPSRKLPEKDFKGRIRDGILHEVSIHIFDKDCFAFQPLYKLSANTVNAWLDKVGQYVKANNINVYAENALNEIASTLAIKAKSFHGHFLEEVDNVEDLRRVNKGIMAKDLDQQLVYANSHWDVQLPVLLKTINCHSPLFVVDAFLKDKASELMPDAVVFSSFTPNPKYEDIKAGIQLFVEKGCDAVISLGGGSCIDVAKTIKYSVPLDLSDGVPSFKKEYVHTQIKHISIPTTSGTGSESTRHAAIYYQGIKQSFSHYSLVPDYVILDPSFIQTVPPFIKRATCLDAFCQCVESTWSKKATPKSRNYAMKGIRLFKECLASYLNNEKRGAAAMQLVAHYSGKAINISETTAGHAMSYALTTRFGTPHGYAVALCLNALSRHFSFADNKNYYPLTHKELSSLLEIMGLEATIPCPDAEQCATELANKANVERLANFPHGISKDFLKKLYLEILA